MFGYNINILKVYKNVHPHLLLRQTPKNMQALTALFYRQPSWPGRRQRRQLLLLRLHLLVVEWCLRWAKKLAR